MHFDVQYLIEHYGYIGITLILLTEMIGVPFPGETVLVLSGIEWTKGTFSLLPLLLFATLGNIIGCSIAYSLGFSLGRSFLIKFGKIIGITQERLEKAEAKFHKYQVSLILTVKFLAGFRVLVSYLAGINKMPFYIFSIFNTISSLIWVTFFIVFGRYLDIAWEKYHQILHQYFLPSVIIFLLVIGWYLGWKIRQNARS